MNVLLRFLFKCLNILYNSVQQKQKLRANKNTHDNCHTKTSLDGSVSLGDLQNQRIFSLDGVHYLLFYHT